MRVCISYTHSYPIMFLNHTLPFRIYKLCFQANMQVTSTLWPDINSQKLSKHRFRLRWTKSDARTQFKHVKTGQPQRGSDKEAQTSPTPSSWGRWAARAGRPTYRSADQAYGPHRLNFAMWRLPIASLGRVGVLRPVAPSYKYKGGGRE